MRSYRDKDVPPTEETYRDKDVPPTEEVLLVLMFCAVGETSWSRCVSEKAHRDRDVPPTGKAYRDKDVPPTEEVYCGMSLLLGSCAPLAPTNPRLRVQDGA